MTIIKKRTKNAGKDVGERNPYSLLVGMYTTATTWKSVWMVIKTLKVDLPYGPAILLLGEGM
jgi:hypothetical protein